MKTNLRLLWLGMFLAANTAAHAQQLPQLPQFQPNTPAKAAEVNANFETLRGGVNANEGRVTTLEGVNAASRITALEAQNAALTAQLAASVACPANTPTRFTDNGDGTVCDSQTGLMWEKKLAANDVGGNCADATQANRSVRCVNNLYSWSLDAANPPTIPTQNQPDGTLYTDFLEKLNDLKTPNDGTATPCFANHCDWRVPTIGELRSILQAPNPNCTLNPCIDPIFGPTQAGSYWSSSTGASLPSAAWLVGFTVGGVNLLAKTSSPFARAVRGGR